MLWYFLPPSKQPSNKEDFEFIAFCPLRGRNCSSTVAIVLKHMSRIYTIPLSGMKFSNGHRDFLTVNDNATPGHWKATKLRLAVSSLTPLFTRINWGERCKLIKFKVYTSGRRTVNKWDKCDNAKRKNRFARPEDMPLKFLLTLYQELSDCQILPLKRQEFV